MLKIYSIFTQHKLWCQCIAGAGRYTFEGTAAFKRSLARLRGGLRRLNVRDPDEYDEQEYTEAASAVFNSAQVIASQSRYRHTSVSSVPGCISVSDNSNIQHACSILREPLAHISSSL